ncbi:hypothetical protein [Dyella terrae]|uniref:hypothetical protein n=1 Tax=Dyella terrae TaxID=522259 RepID=UPI001EFD72FB|nr:hypothetical protein [Dyella terrae]ULU25929.1 hypothetical protein DYST_02867 [Dyella terrae]
MVVCALTLATWALAPRHKAFDITASIALVAAIAQLVRRPTSPNYFLSGLTLGLVAYFGRNHGMYGAAGSAGILFYLALRCENWMQWRRGIGWFMAGVGVGYLPMFATMLFAHGFTAAFIDSIKFIFEVKSTNLPLPIPWPWSSPFWAEPSMYNLRELVIGLFFLTMLVFGLVAPIVVLVRRWKRQSVQPALVACAFLALPYAHYSFSRADPEHLALGIMPTLIGLCVLAGISSSWKRTLILLPLCALSLLAMLPDHQGWKCMGARNCPRITIGKDQLRADRRTVDDVTLFLKLQHDFAPNGRSAFVTPMQPGVNALLGTKSPTLEIYTAWPRTEAFQREEIARLDAAKPGFVLIWDVALDNREELRYKNTHPLIDDYIKANFEPVQGYSDYSMYEIYRAR